MTGNIVFSKKVSTSFSLDPSSIATLDRKRGKEPRSSFVNNLLKSLEDNQM